MSHKDLCIKAVQRYKGDNAARARAAFRGCTDVMMEDQYGHSGKTRRQILQEYEQHENDCTAALEWLQQLPD